MSRYSLFATRLFFTWRPQETRTNTHSSTFGAVSRLSRPAEVKLHATLVGPWIHRLGDELSSIACLDPTGQSAYLRDSVQRGKNIDRKALACVAVHDRQHPQLAPIEQRVRHAIHVPDFIDRTKALLRLAQFASFVAPGSLQTQR